MRVVGVRGAITCDEDTKEEIDAKTQRLVEELLDRNEIEHDDIVSIIFTATDDLTRPVPGDRGARPRPRRRAVALRP